MQQGGSSPDLSWFADVEKLGIIGILVGVLVAVVWRQWLVPWYHVVLLRERIVELQNDKKVLTEVVLRQQNVASSAIEVMKSVG
jgi:hypothetical protein